MKEPRTPVMPTAAGAHAVSARLSGCTWLLVLMSGLTACVNNPAIVLIALPPVVRQPPAAVTGGPATQVLLVRRLVLPEYMVARRVRYSAGVATVAEWPDAYWAERVEIGMAREFVAALRDRLPGWTVCDGDCGGATPDLTLSVALLRLDVVRRELHLRASSRAQLVAAEPGAQPLQRISSWTERYDLAIPADSPQGEAAAMRDLVTVLADDAARSLLRAHASVPTPGTP